MLARHAEHMDLILGVKAISECVKAISGVPCRDIVGILLKAA